MTKLLRWALDAGIVSLAVHVGVWPLLAYYFHQISIVGLIANWTIFPLSSILMILGLLLGTWGVLVPVGVPPVLIWMMHGLMGMTLVAIERMSAWSWAAIPVPKLSWEGCLVYYLLLIGILWKLHDAQKTARP